MKQSEPRTNGIPAAIQEMVRRLVTKFGPEQIILFGSYARGTAGPNSDADLLIVMEVDGRKRPVLAEMFGELAGVGLAKDLILVTPEELDQYKDDPGFIFYTAVREGKVLYDKAGQRV